MEDRWTLYMIECADGTFYTGIARDLERRLSQHGTPRGAKYTRGRGPFRLRYTETDLTHSQALSRERQIKALSRQEKENLGELQQQVAIVLTSDDLCEGGLFFWREG